MIVIVDYGVGNLASIINMFKKLDIEVVASNDPASIKSADRLILPGVGAYDTCASNLVKSNLVEDLNHAVFMDRKPILGLCVGMQLLLESSEEGVLPGLGWIKGKCVKFRGEAMNKKLKVPHMGWTDVVQAKPTGLLENIPEPRFYFVHSYHAQLNNVEDGIIKASYGYEFFAGIQKDNILGVQFHPEKSHRFGQMLFKNFAENF